MHLQLNEIKQPHIVNFSKIGSSPLGFITVAEELPFEIKRVYWTYYTPHEVIRGQHAHKALEQFIFAVSGTIKLDLEDLNGKQTSFILDSPEKGLYIPPLHWRSIQFSHNAVLLCLASMPYEEADYIRSYSEFKNGNYTL